MGPSIAVIEGRYVPVSLAWLSRFPILVLLLAGPWPHPADAQSGSARSAVVGAQVRLLGGKTVKLSPPVALFGELKTPQLTISRLNIGALDKITAVRSKSGRRSLVLALRDGTEIAGAAAGQRTWISGRGSWGAERIPLARIAEVVLSHSAPHSKPAVAANWRAVMRDGSSLAIGLGSAGRGFGTLHGTLARVSLGLRLHAVKRLEFAGGLAKVIGHGDRVIAAGWRPSGRFVPSRMWYGTVRIGWGQVRSIESLSATPAAGKASLYRITLADGRAVSLSGVRLGGFSAWIKDALIRFDRGPVAGATLSPGGKAIELSMIDGRTMRATDFQGYRRLSLSATEGTLSATWGHITRIERVEAGAEPNRTFVPQWQLVTKQGLALPVRDLRFHRGRLARGAPVSPAIRRRPAKPAVRASKPRIQRVVARRINWGAAAEVKPGPNGLQVTFEDETSIVLSQAIAAKSPYGTVSVPAGALAALTKVAGARFPIDKVAGGRVLGTIATTGGRKFKVRTIAFEGGIRVHRDRRLWGYSLLITRVPPVEYWSSTSDLLKRGISYDAGRVLGRPVAGIGPVPLTGIRGVQFSNASGAFYMPAALVGPYRPVAAPAAAAAAPFKARFRLRVHQNANAGKPLEVADLSFARYPSRGFSGRYTRSSYPFQWHRSRRLFFTRQDTGSRVEIEIGRLRRIAVLGRYTAGRRASLTNREGDTIGGAIHPGDRARGHGVSRWNAANEGLLGRLAEGSYVFVRFKDVTLIELEQIAPGK